MVEYVYYPGKEFKVPVEKLSANDISEERLEELGFYQQAHDMGLIRRTSLAGIGFEYAMMTTDADFSPRAKKWIDAHRVVSGGGENIWSNLFVYVQRFSDQDICDAVGLYEQIHTLIEDSVDRWDAHLIANREMFRLLRDFPEIYGKVCNFWYETNKKEGKRIPFDFYGVGEWVVDCGNTWHYFGDIVPELGDIIAEGAKTPQQVMAIYRRRIGRRFKDVRIRLG